jgi:hypothetical protein
VSEDEISLERLDARVAALTAEVRDLQIRFGTLEQHFGAQEERTTTMLALLVRVAERLDGGTPG